MKKYIISGLFLFGILIPVISFAMQADIDPNGPVSGCISLQNSNLRYKARDINTNSEISTLQDFLQSKNFLNSEPTGYFGLLTQKAVKDFQSANGISPTGYVGPITKAKISAVTCGEVVIVPVTPVLCTMEAKQCPDGSYVSRTGPKCEFTECPTDNFNLPAGCTPTSGFSSTTGKRCKIIDISEPSLPVIPSFCANGTINPPECNLVPETPKCANSAINFPTCTINSGGQCIVSGAINPPLCNLFPEPPRCLNGADNFPICTVDSVTSVELKANGSDGPITVPANSSVTVTWKSSDAGFTNCGIGMSNSDMVFPVTLNGIKEMSIGTNNVSIVLSCAGPNSSASDAVAVNIASTDSNPFTDPNYNKISSVPLSNLEKIVTYTYPNNPCGTLMTEHSTPGSVSVGNGPVYASAVEQCGLTSTPEVASLSTPNISTFRTYSCKNKSQGGIVIGTATFAFECSISFKSVSSFNKINLFANALTAIDSINSTGAFEISSTLVIKKGVTLNVRDSIGLKGKLLGEQKGGATGNIIGGPINLDGYRWWQIDYTTGVDGWSAGEYFEIKK